MHTDGSCGKLSPSARDVIKSIFSWKCNTNTALLSQEGGHIMCIIENNSIQMVVVF